MRLFVIITLLDAGLLVVALAVYLGLVAYHLSKVNFTLGTVLIGVRSIANQTELIQGPVASIASDVDAIDKALAALVKLATTPGVPQLPRRKRDQVTQ